MSEALNEEPISLRDSLSSAFEADEAAPAPEPVEAAPPVEGQPRAADGKFAPKADGVQAAASIPTDQPAVAAPEAQPEPIRPPASWSAQAKADFATLPQHIQQEVLRRETEVNKGFEERAAKLKQYEPIEEAIAPLRAVLAQEGIDAPTYLRGLTNADQQLRGPNKLQALAQVANMYGIDLRQFAQPGQPQQQPFQAQPQVDIQGEIDRRFQALQNQTRTEQTQAQIEAFSRDNLYFENVKPAMAAIIQSDPAIAQLSGTDPAAALKAVYDQACWASPTVRPLMLKQQAEEQAQAQKAAANAKVQGARQASGSLTGSPAPGSAPMRNGPAPNIRDALAEAWDA